MPELDVSDAFLCVEFADRFDVVRRPQEITTYGRAQVVDPVTFPGIVGTVYPTGENHLVRVEDYQTGRKTLTVVTRFRLQMTSPGYDPDIVVWPPGGGDHFIVRNIEDYARWGTGMIVAECSSVDPIDLPPGAVGD